MGNPNGLINSRGNPGKSIVIQPDPLTLVNAASLAVVPAQDNSPVGSATLISLTTDDEESEVVTITLDNPNPSDTPNILSVGPTTSALARATAKIEWGVNGVQSAALVDFEHGLNFSVPSSYLRVTAISEPLPDKVADLQGTGLAVFGRNVKLGAFCGYGSSSGTKNNSAKKTIYWDKPLQFGAQLQFKIPAFATNFICQRQNQVAALVVNVRDEGGNVIYQVTYPVGGTIDNPIELSGDAAFISVLGIPPSVTSMRFIFGLSF